MTSGGAEGRIALDTLGDVRTWCNAFVRKWRLPRALTCIARRTSTGWSAELDMT
jgi:hypothetical protein